MRKKRRMSTDGPTLTIVLEQAQFELVNVKRGGTMRTELLSSDPRTAEMNVRPELVHQTLLNLLDCPLCKSGHLKILIHTESGVVISVSPSIRIPRTYGRFAPLIVKVLEEGVLRTVVEGEEGETLMERLEGSIEQHMAGRRVVLEPNLSKLVEINQYVNHQLEAAADHTFIIGVSTAEEVELAYHVDDFITVSEYEVAASYLATKVTTAFERLYAIE
ncbi:Ribosomal biogenesis methyltransferase EMG1/NEP1 [Carpediemonas membranifera]|uniref:Ribosomal biogenesis methyltransferase EMG1/NEP1 n=1 Tax=Carpediemonas membranifera TaxID=201153 RepID=A0A8J6B3Z9_9EUKA|nr:Ribosomal biogenesis methyltransferase EMG1/NEP1 [Carpediemonas membranifera]|eukprot:KAG9392447.1 Ribosomal biogenesis methyltransferase EMG1/NEP1 [Carpediemonas membranifera]